AVQPDTVRLLELYVERFNRRDWDALRDLISADAKLFFADGFGGLLRESPYFGKYGEVIITWRMASGSIDGEPAVIILVDDGAGWQPRSAVRLEFVGGKIAGITDYLWCPWILPAAGTLDVSS
ncbi:MAG: RNA polymerase subunit sigma-70, partial [Vulcanimicrobiaceae bacterium]